jgi:hypothetical protein
MMKVGIVLFIAVSFRDAAGSEEKEANSPSPPVLSR